MSVLEQLLTELEQRATAGGGVTRTKAVSSTPRTTGYGHGPGGLFAYPGLSMNVFNAMLLPNLGLMSILPSRTNNEENPLHALMTGVTAGSGSNPDGPCDDPPTAGLMKLCMRSFVFGRQSLMTPVIEIDRVGRLTNRGEFNDLQLIGDPFAVGNNPIVPSVPGGGAKGALRNEVSKVFFELAVEWGRRYAPILYTGNPTNNTANGGYKEPYGLDILINTGLRDAVTGIVCPAADSYVRSFASRNISDYGDELVNEIVYMVRNTSYIASRTGLTPVTWALVMSDMLFYELTKVWPCSYMTYGCGVDGTNDRRVVDAGDLLNMRDEMRQGKYLLVDGEQVQVVVDDAIAETQSAGGTFESDIYYVPLRVVGGVPATYLEYINYDAPNGPMEAAREFGPDGSYWTTDGGRYLWHAKPPTNYCVQSLVKGEWRVVLETPQIAGRITDVRYTPMVPLRDWEPGASFYVNGGSTAYGNPSTSFYTPSA